MKYLISLICILLFHFSTVANTYFVSKLGNDSNLGSATSPWLTIQKAADVLIAGDTVFIKQGTYNESVLVQNSGANTNEIVFTCFQNDEVILDGTGISLGGWNGLFDVSNQSYIKVVGLKIQNSTFAGFFAENSSYIDFRNNKTYNTFSSGIAVWDCSFVSVWNNEIELACNDGGEECITISNSNNCEVYYNEVHHGGAGTNGGEGIDVKQGSYTVKIVGNVVHHLTGRLGIYVDAWDAHTYDVLISKNNVYNCKESGIALASESGGLLEYVRIENNISHHNKYGGIEIGSWSDIAFTGDMPIKHIEIVNNTCYKNGSYDGGWGYGIVVDNPDAEDVLLRNNICSQNSAQIAIENILSGGVADHNLIDGLNNLPECIYGTDSIVGNPEFWEESLDNYNLKITSIAIDNGSGISAPLYDFNSYIRPQGLGIDIGAFEYNASAGFVESGMFDLDLELFPNPAQYFFTIKINNPFNEAFAIRIIDIYGKVVRLLELENTSTIVISNGLSGGVYFVEVTNVITKLKSVRKITLNPY